MNKVVTFPLIILIFVSINCQSAFIAETVPKDTLYKYNKQSEFIKEKAAALRRLFIYPSPSFCKTSNIQEYERWNEFVNKQHDDFTIDSLLYLYHTSSKEIVQRHSLEALSHQKKTRLMPLWMEILETPGDLSYGFRWFAISGLESIQTQQSNHIVESIFSNPTTPPEILLDICKMYKEKGVSQDCLERILQLTNHHDGSVRHAAYKLVWCDSKESRNQIYRRMFADEYTEIVKRGLRGFSVDITTELFPDVFKLLDHPDVSIRVLADNLFQNYLSEKHSETNKTQKFKQFRDAFEKNLWTYQNAPLLTRRYAKCLEDKGEYADAEKALQLAQESYASNSAYKHSNHNAGATMLFRLIQIRRKRSDIVGALDILNKLVNEYSKETKILLEDFPHPWNNTKTTVGKLEPTLRRTLENIPVRIIVTPDSAKYQLGQDPRFNVSIFNNRNVDVTLYCVKHIKNDTFLLPANVTVGSFFTRFSNEDYTKNVKVKIPPKGSISFVRILDRYIRGIHLINSSFLVKCELENGRMWYGEIYGNSVTVNIQAE